VRSYYGDDRDVLQMLSNDVVGKRERKTTRKPNVDIGIRQSDTPVLSIYFERYAPRRD